MATLADLQVARESVTLVYGGKEVALGYNTEVITPQWLEYLSSFQGRAGTMTDDEARDELASLVCGLLLDWDVKGDAEETIPAPLTHANVRGTAINFQRAILMRLVEDMQAKNRQGTARATSRKRSRHTSSRKAS